MFRALNETFSPSPESASSVSRAIDEVFGLDGTGSMPAAEDSLGFQNRDYKIEKLGDRREENGVEEFEVHWTKSEVPRRFIVRGKNNATVVRCDGRRCEILEHTQLRAEPEEIHLVEWTPTWLTREQLEELGYVPGSGTTPDAQRPKKRRKKSGQREEAADENPSAWPAADIFEPLQAQVTEMKFQPMARLAYTDGVRELLLKNAIGGKGGLLRELLTKPKQQELIFRDRFVEKSSFFNALENKYRLGTAIQIAGDQQQKECEYCSKGNGPFDRCVLLPSASKTACGNCVYGGVAKSCNYHAKTRVPGGPWTPQKIETPTAPAAAASRLSPRARAIKKALDAKRKEKADQSRTANASASQSRPEPVTDTTNQQQSNQQQSNEDHSTKPGKLKKPKKRDQSEITEAENGAMEGPQSVQTHSRSREGTAAVDVEQPPSPSRQSRTSSKSCQKAPSSSLQSEPHPQPSPATTRPSCQEWQTNYLAPDFRHERCPPSPSPCRDFMAGCKSPDSELKPVSRQQIFKRGEATSQQVRWLISRSDCYLTELMHRAWLFRLGQRNEFPLPKGCTKEAFLSQWQPGNLNRAADKYGKD